MKIFRDFSALFLSLLLLTVLLAACGETLTTEPGGTGDFGSGDTALSDSTQDSPGTDGPTISGDPTDGLPAEMPVIRIDTDGEPIVSKEYYIDGSLSLDNTRAEYALADAAIEIRGRGIPGLIPKRSPTASNLPKKPTCWGRAPDRRAPGRFWRFTATSLFCAPRRRFISQDIWTASTIPRRSLLPSST